MLSYKGYKSKLSYQPTKEREAHNNITQTSSARKANKTNGTDRMVEKRSRHSQGEQLNPSQPSIRPRENDRAIDKRSGSLSATKPSRIVKENGACVHRASTSSDASYRKGGGPAT